MTCRSVFAALLTSLGLGLLPCAAAQQQGPAPPPASAPAQAPPPPTDPAARVTKAIDDYKAAEKPAQRRRTLLWLGEIDHAEATTFLQHELATAGDDPFAATVLDAIAKLPRPALRDDALAALQRETSPAAVKKSAAVAVVAMGEHGIDKLLEIAAAGDDVAKPPVRDAAAAALVESKVDRALRGLAQLLLTGPMPERLKLLHRMEGVHGVTAVNASRIQLVHEGNVEVAAAAWRQLAVEKHERAKPLTVDVLERIVGDPKPQVAADLIGGLVRVRDPDFYPAVLRFGAIPGDVVKRALRANAAAAAEDPELVKFLVSKGLDEEAKPATRDVAKLLLLEAPVEAVRPLIERIRADLRAGKKKAQEMAVNLHELLSKDPTWASDLLGLALSNDPERRMLGLSLLNEIGADTGIPAAQKGLDDREWQVRSLCMRYLSKCRDVTSIPLLIARVGKEEGRLAAELDQTLFMHTGTRFLLKKEWEAWWRKNKDTFTMPHAETVKAVSGTSTGGNTVAYHDIPVVSNRICFLVDHSGSMHERMGTDKQRTRIDVAKEQLIKVVSALPASYQVNLILLESEVRALWDGLQPLDDDHRKKLIDVANSVVLMRGTNIFDALQKAFEDPKVDTIYLLTDGQPTEGQIKDPNGIVDEIQHWNRQRQIVIHCIGLGIDSDMLKRLAATSGGSYKYVK